MIRNSSKNVAQMFPKVAQIDATSIFTYGDPFQNSPKSHQCFWATFVSKFVSKNFQKSPNLVTLATRGTKRLHAVAGNPTEWSISSLFIIDVYDPNVIIL